MLGCQQLRLDARHDLDIPIKLVGSGYLPIADKQMKAYHSMTFSSSSSRITIQISTKIYMEFVFGIFCFADESSLQYLRQSIIQN